jgi:LacI family transcriptional regulator
VTLADVAAHAHVSRATASLVLRNSGNLTQETRDRVRAAMDALGYVYHRGAASLRAERTQSVGVVVPDLSIEFTAELVTGLEVALAARGIVTLIATSAESVAHQDLLVRSMLERQVDGLIIIPAASTRRGFVEQLARSGVPAITVTREIPTPTLPYVGIDNLHAGREVGKHLLFHERRRIAYLGGLAELRPRRDRIHGLKQVFAGAGSGTQLVVDVPGPAKGPWALAAMDELLRSGPAVDGIVCHNDVVAFGVQRALRTHGVPADGMPSVISYDDIATAALSAPPLTTVGAHGKEIGERCAEVLMRRVENPHGPSERRLISADLIVRESCGCPPAG